MELKDLKTFWKLKDGNFVLDDVNIVENITDILKFAINISNKYNLLQEDVKKLKSNVNRINNKLHDEYGRID